MFFLMLHLLPVSTLFPYTTLFRSRKIEPAQLAQVLAQVDLRIEATVLLAGDVDEFVLDRKSTRLNSSHVEISYAVFCLKKKKQTPNATSSSLYFDCLTFNADIGVF